MNGNPHLTIGYQLRGESQMQIYEGWSPTYELKKSAVWGAKHLHGGMRRVSAHDPY